MAEEHIETLKQGLMATFGKGTPRDQMVWSVILGVAAYVATALSAGATAIFILLFTITFLVGLVRFVWALAMG